MRELTDVASCFLFDFDGPVCRLFHRHSAASVAERLRTLITAECGDGVDALASLPRTEDPHRILEAALDGGYGDEFVATLEKALTQEELEAAPHAYPTAYADRLIRTLHATGRRLAISTNNSPEAVERYLRTRATEHVFAGYIHGRAPDDLRLKPDPSCIERALESTGTRAADALMIGDAPRDYQAAKALGVPFLGYARNGAKEARLRAVGAERVVGSLAEVLTAVDPAARI